MMLEFERDPAFRMDDVHDLTRPEVRERIMTRVNYINSDDCLYYYVFDRFLV